MNKKVIKTCALASGAVKKDEKGVLIGQNELETTKKRGVAGGDYLNAL